MNIKYLFFFGPLSKTFKNDLYTKNWKRKGVDNVECFILLKAQGLYLTILFRLTIFFIKEKSTFFVFVRYYVSYKWKL